MDWNRETLRSYLRGNRERLIVLFCAGLLLFVLAIPSDGGKNAGGAENGQAESGQTAETGMTRESAGSTLQPAGTGRLSDTSGSRAVAASPAGDSYEQELEERLEALLQGVDGVGEVNVMVVLKSSAEQVVHVDTTSTVALTEGTGGADGAIRQWSEAQDTVLVGQSQTPIIEKERMPELSGIVICADGGGNAKIRAEISEAMEALLGLPAHKIKVLKRAAPLSAAAVPPSVINSPAIP